MLNMVEGAPKPHLGSMIHEGREEGTRSERCPELRVQVGWAVGRSWKEFDMLWELPLCEIMGEWGKMSVEKWPGQAHSACSGSFTVNNLDFIIKVNTSHQSILED